ncbi:MAG: hypothetical protein ABI689_00205 [Thermoanaerobaculia bacterium]
MTSRPPLASSPGASLAAADRLAILGLGLLAVAASLFSLRATDLFWHLASGRFMVENLALPRLDPFRFAVGGGLPWVDHEWLFQLLVSAVERLGGLDALIALRAVLVLTLAGLLFAAVRRTGGAVAVAVALTAIALLGARPRFLVRPELLTFLALTIELILLRRLVNGDAARRRRTLVALALLAAVWTNFHGLALLAPVVAGAYLLGVALAPANDRASGAGSWRRALATPASLAAAMLLNPYGVRIFAVSVGITGALTDLSAINPEWLPAWRAPQPMLFAGMAALLALVADTAVRFRRVHLPTGLVTGGLAILALTAVRHQALFFIAGVFLAAETLALRRAAAPQATLQIGRRASSFWPAAGAALLCLLLAAWCLHPPATGPLAPRQGRFELSRGIAPHRFPEAAANWLERHPGIGPLYNELAHGGYLLWRLYPPRQVFLDGRMELEPGLLREIEVARTGAENWQRFLRRRGATGALVRYEDRTRPVFATDPATGRTVVVARQTPNAALFPAALWALVYWDDEVLLFLDRARAKNRPLLTAEYAAIQPEDTAATLARASDSQEYRALALADVERRLVEDPTLHRAAWLRDRLRAGAPAAAIDSAVEAP